jgi:hypothetical protein
VLEVGERIREGHVGVVENVHFNSSPSEGNGCRCAVYS